MFSIVTVTSMGFHMVQYGNPNEAIAIFERQGRNFVQSFLYGPDGKLYFYREGVEFERIPHFISSKFCEEPYQATA